MPLDEIEFSKEELDMVDAMNIREELKEISNMKPAELAEKLREIMNGLEYFKVLTDSLKKKKDYCAMYLDNYLVENKTKSQNFDGIGTVVKSTRTFGSVEDKELLFNHLRDNGQEDLIIQIVMDSELNKLAKEYFDKGLPMPPGLSYSRKSTISLRRS